MRNKIGAWGSLLAAAACLVAAAGRSSAATLPVGQIDFSDPAVADLVQLNGAAELAEIDGRQRLRLTEQLGQAAGVWLRRPLRLPSYIAEFDFEVRRTEPGDQPADGFTFTAQEYGPIAIGEGGGGLGYTGIPGYSYAIEFNTYASQGLRNRPETVALDIVGKRTKLGQVPFPHIDQGMWHAAIAVRREAIQVTVSGGKDGQAPTSVFSTPWWIQFDTDRPLWFGFTGGTGGLRSTIDIMNLKITAS